MDSSSLASANVSKSRRVLTDEERHTIFESLLKQIVNGSIKKGTFTDVSMIFSVKPLTVQRIWKQAKIFMDNGLKVDVSNKFAKNVGRKRVEIDPSLISKIPLHKRTNIRSLVKAANMAKSTIHRRIKEGLMRPHSNALKPLVERCPVFKDMFEYVHIDEKWFYMTKESQKFYLLPEEEDPVRSCKIKRFITKIMFLAAVARPRFVSSGNEEFSGKIGIFPFTFKEPAKRNSKNCQVGKIETKPILSVTKDVVRDCLINKVLPAIRQKWPTSNTSVPIFIQQDNAKPHIDSNDAVFVEAASRDGFDIRLSFQPPNNPDFNVLDLGFFRALQSLQHQEAPTTVDELVLAIEKAFEELSTDSLNRVFLTYQMCMIDTMKVCEGNNYKLPHIGKNHLMQSGNLPIQLECEAELLENSRKNLELAN